MIGIAGIHHVIPETGLELEILEQKGLVQTDAATLREFGFTLSRTNELPLHELAKEAVGELLGKTATSPDEVQFFLSSAALQGSLRLELPRSNPVERYDSECVTLGQRLAAECGLLNTVHLGIGQVGCTSLLATVRVAAAILEAETDATCALCLTVDECPDGSSREVMYNVVSDSACAVLLRKDHPHNQIIRSWQLSRPEFWDASTHTKDALAVNYFPLSRRFILDCLASEQLTLDDIAMVMPHNVSLNSWVILASALGLPIEKVYTHNIHLGHTFGADCFINLHDALSRQLLKTGDRVLMFGFGMGGHWAAALVRV